MLTPKAIESFKDFVEKNTVYGQYKIGSTYYKAPIHRRERLPDGKVAVYFEIEPNSLNAVRVTEVRLYDRNNDAFVIKLENVEIESVQDGLLYRFTFDFKEVQ